MVSFLFLLAAKADTLRPLTPPEIQGLRVWDDGRTNAQRVGDRIRFTWQIRFKNETPREIGSIQVRLINDNSGRRTFNGPPVTLKGFSNSSAPHTGSILPYNKTEFKQGVVFEMPARLWDTDSYPRPELVGATTFRSPDLHDMGHLYTRLLNSRAPDAIALLKKDPSLLKVRNSEGLTTMLAAVATSAPEVIEYVAAHGGSYGETSQKGSSAMHLAAINGYPGTLDLIAKHGGKVDARAQSGRTPLMKAIVHGMPLAWNWLLKHGASVNVIDRGGWSPAHYAVQEGQMMALQAMMRYGLKPTTHDPTGQGLLHYAVFNYVLLDQVRALGVPVDDRNPRNGQTPLMVAAWSGWTEPQVWFLRNGANPNLKDKQGRTAYDYARQRGSESFFRTLVAKYGRR